MHAAFVSGVMNLCMLPWCWGEELLQAVCGAGVKSCCILFLFVSVCGFMQ